MSMKVLPSGKKILVLRDKPEAVSDGGILLPPQAQTQTQTGVIQAVGPDVVLSKDGTRIGARILFQNYGFTEVNLGEEPLLVMEDEDILLCLEEE